MRRQYPKGKQPEVEMNTNSNKKKIVSPQLKEYGNPTAPLITTNRMATSSLTPFSQEKKIEVQNANDKIKKSNGKNWSPFADGILNEDNIGEIEDYQNAVNQLYNGGLTQGLPFFKKFHK
ncbi:hypothetical protein LIER_29528 [Lithospermum erythrorhizon]|uniref:Uncharacterized protein n=1 Tax=Lithospermum erythrorhizon TaxID=34254 RepID=A0AAV3RJG0_LITER